MEAVKRKSMGPHFSMCLQPAFIIGTNNEDGTHNFARSLCAKTLLMLTLQNLTLWFIRECITELGSCLEKLEISEVYADGC